MNAPTTGKSTETRTEPATVGLPSGLAPRAEGPRIYNLFPLLVGTVSAWTAEIPRIAALGFDWIYLNPFHQTGGSRSLYAVQDTDRLDARFRDDDGTPDDEQIARFCRAAEAQGIAVMTDLVINHTADNARLFHERPDLFVRDGEGRPVSPGAVDPDDPSKMTVWGDLIELDYHSEQARYELTGIFDAYMARLQDLGVRGFRCDAAYKVPAEVWRSLIASAKARDPETLFAAETLGCTFEEAQATAGAGFDYLFNSFAWWDLKAPWALEQYDRLRVIAPSIAFPENHDMPRLAADIGGGEAISARLKTRYALSAFFSAGVLMPIGYEWGYRRALHVVDTTPRSREHDTGIDISSYVAAINALKAELPSANVEGAQLRLSSPDASYVALFRTDTGHPASATHGTIVLYNPSDAPAPVDAGRLIARTGGRLGAFVDRTPESDPIAFHPGAGIDLLPGELRVLAADAPTEKAAPKPTKPSGEGRVVIEAVSPEIDGGRSAVKRIVGESVRVEADIFSDGHEIIAAAVLSRIVGEGDWRRDPMVFVDNDRWAGQFPLERNARYEFTVEAWRDGFSSWARDTLKKRDAGVDVKLETVEGVELVQIAADLAVGRDKERLAALVSALAAEQEASPAVLDRILEPKASSLVRRNAERVNLSRYPVEIPVIADRLAARFSAWYEIFPRSQSGDPDRHGTFQDVIRRLPHIRQLGFDVLYFTPIHPIGKTNRKGKNNTLKAEPGDVGSVYAVGAAEGGHEAVHPDLGTLDDFRQLVAASHANGMEIALDFAIQCSPDHPWIKSHPEWFEWRPDGTLKFAENPPKKYEDISNVHFYGGALPSLWIELRDIVMGWCALGVRIFRVDNPHTKPIPFWEWMLREVNGRYPDAIFLAEAFTRPKMMKKLAKAGYQQSYTYFTWRNTKQDLIDYSIELAGEMGEYYRPNFFANTPDINPYYLQTSGRPGFVVRATLAATLSSVYGIYNGFELCEAAPYPGKEEYLNSEKYELKAWDEDRPGNIREHIIKLNRIRRDNPALQDFRNVVFTGADNGNIIAYAKATPEGDNCVFTMINLDPKSRQECSYEIPLWLLGQPDDGALEVEDLLEGYKFELRGRGHRIALDPAERSCVIWRLRLPQRVAR